MNSERFRLTAVALAIAAGAACADLERGDPRPDSAPAIAPDGAAPDGAIAPDAPAALSFARDVHRLVLDGCARCHSSNGQASNSTFVLVDDAAKDRLEVLMFINPDNPAGSRFLTKGAGNGHGGGAIYTASSPEYRTILDWILQGGSP